MNNDIRRICLTPTRNEAWIIARFVAAAKHWASDIIVADQNSSDGTLQHLLASPGVHVVTNKSLAYDESYRQRVLIDRARQIAGKRILMALDADEALSANCIHSLEWDRIKDAKPGTVLRFRWVNVLPNFEQAWIPPALIPCGYIDDGSAHTGNLIHSRRVPWPRGAPVVDFEEVVVLHFQYIVRERVISKHRWYQAWEHVNFPTKGALEIFRQYHHMYGSWSKNEIQPMKRDWLEGYNKAGIDFKSLASEPVTWWDREVLGMLLKHGPAHFRRIALWDWDWHAVAEKLGMHGFDLRDPRSVCDKIAHRLLKATQGHRTNWGVRGFERLLRVAGW